MNGPLVGIDLGGTSIRVAVASGGGAAAHGATVRRDTPAEQGPAAVLDACADAVREACRGTTPAGVAIGIPGPLSSETGVVSAAPHLRGWEGVNARDLLAERLGCPVTIANDASLAGYAEWTVGAGAGTVDFIFITASTGIGGALVLGGSLQRGAAGTAGELGHVAADMNGPRCGQGHVGCLEGVASGTAMARRAQAAVRDGTVTSLSLVPPHEITAIAIERAAEQGDAFAREVFAETGRALGRAVGGLINILAPEVIAIGGGLIHAGELLFGPIHGGVREIAFALPLSKCRIMAAALGTDAGIVGAVAWAVRQYGEA